MFCIKLTKLVKNPIVFFCLLSNPVLNEMPMEESSYYVTMGINIFGYMFYASFLISPIPGFLVNRLKACLKTTDERAEMHGLSLLLGLAVSLAVILSVQMCIKGSIPNGIAVVIEFSFLRTVFFIMRSLVRKMSSIQIYNKNNS